MNKGSGSRYGIFPDPDPGDPKRPDPTGSGIGSATLVKARSDVIQVWYMKLRISADVQFSDIVVL